jgi:hypothetical protein
LERNFARSVVTVCCRGFILAELPRIRLWLASAKVGLLGWVG